jgi:hypothetical protein
MNLNFFKSKYFIYLTSIFILLTLTCSKYSNNNSASKQASLNNFNSNAKNYNKKISFISKSNNILANFNVAIANNPELQRIGLMHLKSLPKNFGMLFIKDYPQIITMWMKNTQIPLDMIFLDKDFKIIKIHKYAIPYSLETILCEDEALAVLELNGGIANEYNLNIGDKLIFQN